MLATLGGFLALALGLTVLLLPLLVPELSRPRDAVWGAVVLLLGLVLVTSADRLTGAPMLAVLCGGLLIGRLGTEVGQGRWRALSDEERSALLSPERWGRSFSQLGASAASLLEAAAGLASGLAAWQTQRSQGRAKGKRWVRAEADDPARSDRAPQRRDQAPEPAPDTPAPMEDPQASEASRQPQAVAGAVPAEADAGADSAAGSGSAMADEEDVPVVSDFSEIDALLAAAEPAPPSDGDGPPPPSAG